MVDYRNTPLEKLLDVELNMIESLEVRNKCKALLESIDKEHPIVRYGPASSSGKFHPAHDLGDGGVIRHTKVVVKFANELAQNTPVLEEEKDNLIAAAILHDMGKYHTDCEAHTDEDHPLWMATYCSRRGAPEFARLIESHHGKWVMGTHDKTLVVNKEPDAFDKWVLHYADLLASKKYVHCEFDELTGCLM